MRWTSNNIRQSFLEYFKSKEHEIVESAPIVIKDDPTLMFTNAGMNQFKSVFVGNSESKNARIADSQKCLRVSGKHNDLDEVGRDHYHHTMFEMLGNWSFGDYFKQEAIDWAWQLLTEVYELDKSRLYVSYFNGDDELKIGADMEAKQIWSKHLEDDRVLAYGRKENFWEMGETGPCGPCSEIHFDMRSDIDREKVDGAELVNQDHPEVIEVWNLVFMQYNRLENGSLVNLKNKHIDTGMGLERLARILQNVGSNYDIDIFKAIINELEKISGKKYGGSESNVDIAFRVIADHLRAVSFCIADGQLPSNTGAGYVIRRVLRRAVRYGYSQLGLEAPFMFMLLDSLENEMGAAYTELAKNKDLILKVIQEEEKSFLTTLAKGLERIQVYIASNKGNGLSGDFAFELYDTYGFPIDLTQLIAEEANESVDMTGFEKALEKQKKRSRDASKSDFGDWVSILDGENSAFVGYDQLEEQAHVAKYRQVNLKGKECYQFVLDRTPFYAESGGQIGDKGILKFGDESISVFDTKRENNEILHFSNDKPAKIDQVVTAIVSADKRMQTMKNHSATHLLHHVLRSVLGNHVEQKGSMVSDKKLRFDFSHFEKIDANTLQEIENQVKEMISEAIDLKEWREMPISEAKELGAMALFGEKYGDFVRVVKFGDSIELCGGTHVENTNNVAGFKIMSEAGIASGVRRIEAITGAAFEKYINSQLELLESIQLALNNPADVLATVKNLQTEVRNQKAKIDHFTDLEKSLLRKELIADMDQVKSGIRAVAKIYDGKEAKLLKEVAHDVVKSVPDGALVLGSSIDDRATLVVAIGLELLEKGSLNASAIIRQSSELIDGKGGGQPFLSVAGGSNKKGLNAALKKSIELLKENA